MAKLESANVLMFGSKDDSVYLGDWQAGLLDSVTALDSEIPAALEDMGWVSEDGFSVNLEDSKEEIRGHQGHGVVLVYISDSSTSITVALLEVKAKPFMWNLGGVIEKVGGTHVKITAPASRPVINLTGLIDAFDTNTKKSTFRILFPKLSLTEREGLQFKVGEVTMLQFNLEVIGDWYLLSNHAALMA